MVLASFIKQSFFYTHSTQHRLAYAVRLRRELASPAGYEPMVNPAVTEIEVVLQRAQKDVAKVAPAEQAYRAAQAALAVLRPRADGLIQDVLDELRFELRKKDTATQRGIMRTYGVRYRYLPGETREADEANLP